MLSSVLYYASIIIMPTMVYLLVIIFVAAVVWISMKKIDVTSEATMIGTLFASLNKKDFTKLAAVSIRTFMIAYTAVNFTNDNFILYYMTIIMSSLLYAILEPKKAVFEIVNTAAQIVILYIIMQVQNYRIDMNNQNQFVFLLQLLLIIFIMTYAFVCFMRDLSVIIEREKKWKIRKRKERIQ